MAFRAISGGRTLSSANRTIMKSSIDARPPHRVQPAVEEVHWLPRPSRVKRIWLEGTAQSLRGSAGVMKRGRGLVGAPGALDLRKYVSSVHSPRVPDDDEGERSLRPCHGFATGARCGMPEPLRGQREGAAQSAAPSPPRRGASPGGAVPRRCVTATPNVDPWLDRLNGFVALLRRIDPVQPIVHLGELHDLAHDVASAHEGDLPVTLTTGDVRSHEG